MLKLNLPKYDYLLKKEDDKLFIYDFLRKKYLVLTPEEWVRQHFINFLVNYKNVSKSLIKVEGGIKYNSLFKRFDLLAFSRSGRPLLLVECKSSTTNLEENAVFQLATYNFKIDSSYLAVTNGITHLYWEKGKDSDYERIKDLPDFKRM